MENKALTLEIMLFTKTYTKIHSSNDIVGHIVTVVLHSYTITLWWLEIKMYEVNFILLMYK